MGGRRSVEESFDRSTGAEANFQIVIFRTFSTCKGTEFETSNASKCQTLKVRSRT